MKTHTNEFEKFWATLNAPQEFKEIAWLVWRKGRELLAEELQHHQLQRKAG